MKFSRTLLAAAGVAAITLSACGKKDGAMSDSAATARLDSAALVLDSLRTDSIMRADSVRLDSIRRADTTRIDTPTVRPPGAP